MSDHSRLELEIMAEQMQRKLTKEGVGYEELNEVMADLTKLLLDALVDAGASRKRAHAVMHAMIQQTGLYYTVRKKIEQEKGEW